MTKHEEDFNNWLHTPLKNSDKKDHIIMQIGKNPRPFRIVIDPEDYTRVTQYKWHRQTGRTMIRCHKLGTSLQKFVMGVDDPDMTAVHIDGNPWNNRKDNLLVCTLSDASIHTREMSKKFAWLFTENYIKWTPNPLLWSEDYITKWKAAREAGEYERSDEE